MSIVKITPHNFSGILRAMIYSSILLAHIVVATTSVGLLSLFTVQILRRKHTQRLSNIVFASAVLTVLTGVLLMLGGADFVRTCVTMSVYTIACFAVVGSSRYRVSTA